MAGTDVELESRVRSLEEWRHQQDVRSAVQAEQSRHIDERFDNLNVKMDNALRDSKENFDKIFGYVSKLVWLVLSALILAVLGFIFAGGLNLVN